MMMSLTRQCHAHIGLCVCVCEREVCECVREREVCECVCEREIGVCVWCVCVLEREREKDRNIATAIDWH